MQHIKFSMVIFDMDGLMIDSERIAKQGWMQAIDHFGHSIGEDEYLTIIGRTLPDIKNIFFENFGNEFPFEETLELKNKHVDDYITKHGLPVKPGLQELLDYLDQLSIPKIVASSTYRTRVEYKLSVTGLQDRIDQVVCGDEIKNGKPSPDIFLKAAEKINVSKEFCIVLEDSEPGIKAAHSANMIPIMVPDLKQPSHETSSLAFKIFNSLHEVKSFLQEFAIVV